MKNIVFNESENNLTKIGQGTNIENSKLDRFLINNNIQNRSKARTKEQKPQFLLKYLQLDTELFHYLAHWDLITLDSIPCVLVRP